MGLIGKIGKFSAIDLKKLQQQLNKLKDKNVDAFVEECAKELAARLLATVIKRTPVGDYSKGTGKKGGTLRRGWTAGKSSSSYGGAQEYANSLKVNHYGGFLVIEIMNPIEYASYVEYGHRTRGHKGWVPGRFMLTVSEQEVQTIAPKVLEQKIKKYLMGCMQ